ncbi:glycylpeptide N-tetradecanoyltransferase [Ceratobasidium sp. 414]|nr:glycylpeptide N-tetradecanoyltransferase [Ceratobasidium sp. 414]
MSEAGPSDPKLPATENAPSDHGSGSETDEAPAEETTKTAGKAKKKKKKKSKAAKLLAAARGNDVPDDIVAQVTTAMQQQEEHKEVDEDEVLKALKAMKIIEMLQGKTGIGGKNAKDMGEHKASNVLGDERPAEDGPIEPSKPAEEVKQDPYALPSGYEWSTVDIMEPDQAKEVHELLSANYVEDMEAAFRFRYSAEFFAWALQPPGYHKEWLIGVRVSSNRKLVAFIAGVPLKLRVRQNILDVSEINFLCIHKKLRSKRLAPVLIKEVTRRCHLRGIFQAIYTAGVVIPTPVSTARYYHRLIQVEKLVEAGFTHVPRGSTLARMLRLNSVASETKIVGLREMEDGDIKDVLALYEMYMRRFTLTPIMDEEEMRHHMLSGRGAGEPIDGRRQAQVVWAYVVQAKFDVFNALTLMDNHPFLKELNFGQGDGYLNYYLYNWRTAPLEGFVPLPVNEGGQGIGRGIGVVML